MTIDPIEDREDDRPDMEVEAESADGGGEAAFDAADDLEDTPGIEDATDQPHAIEVPAEEDPEPLSHAARSFDEGTATAEPSVPHPVEDRLIHPDDTSDVGEFEDEGPELSEEEWRARGRSRWDLEPEIQHISAELRAIEAEVRSLFEGRDPKRKRKFAGTRRWLELEEEVIALKYSGRFPEESLITIQRLAARRHYLYGRLHFLSGTRPTWNS